MIEKVLVGAFAAGTVAMLAAVFLVSLPLLVLGGLLLLGVFTAGPVNEALRGRSERSQR